MAIYQVTNLGTGYGVLMDGVVVAGPYPGRQQAIKRAIELKESGA